MFILVFLFICLLFFLINNINVAKGRKRRENISYFQIYWSSEVAEPLGYQLKSKIKSLWRHKYLMCIDKRNSLKKISNECTKFISVKTSSLLDFVHSLHELNMQQLLMCFLSNLFEFTLNFNGIWRHICCLFKISSNKQITAN